MGYWRWIKYNSRKWAELTALEKTLFIQAFFLLPVIRISRWMNVQRLQKILGNLPQIAAESANRNPMSFERARQTARMISIAGHRLFGSSCLDRSLALWALLRRQGIDSGIHLGVRKNQEVFEAHAWVEINGIVINDTDDVRQRYSAFDVPITPGDAGLHETRPAHV